MKQSARVLWLSVVGIGLLSAGAWSQSASSRAPVAAKAANAPLLPAFPDFGHMPPPDQYQGRVFKLSQDYPSARPPLDPALKRILAIDFKKDWNAYILAVRDYVFEGNIENRPVSEAFYLEDNKVRPWYHVPWQHFGNFGREGTHGLTKEGPVEPFTLGQAQPNLWQTYAVGFYNQQGGWAIGKVWANPDKPSLDEFKKEGFPEGTVVGKVLFTTAPVAEVPFLSNPIEWNAYVTKCFAPDHTLAPADDCDVKREMATVRFIQMDIMVRDSRAKETGGWVFGTFVYNGNLARPNQWENVVPVGLQWGNDPGVTSESDSNPAPTITKFNPDLKETVVNRSPDMPPMHLGWGLRLNGPVDNTKSSCMSCHSTAQYPAIVPILPFMATENGKPIAPGTARWMEWFRNVQCNTPFDPRATSTDYSLQLAASIQNFVTAKSQGVEGLYNVQYWNGVPVHGIAGHRGVQGK
jgi:hypothetical protein